MQKLLAVGYSVHLITTDDEQSRKLVELGCVLHAIRFSRNGISPLADIRAFWTLYRLYRNYKPILSHHFNAKPVLLGTMAARLALRSKVGIVNSITGLGYAFTRGGPDKWLASIGYRLLMNRSDRVIFENPDDRDLFINSGWIDPKRAVLIVSSGVDLAKFQFRETESEPDRLSVMTACRLIGQKGISDFIKAARIVKAVHPTVSFSIAGEPEPDHPDAMSDQILDEALAEGILDSVGYEDNMSARLKTIDIFVFASYYREGVPRVVLEASATGLPVIGYQVPGTREAIIDGVTGFLVPVRNVAVLAGKVNYLVENPDARKKMGRQGRTMIEAEFDLVDITEKQIDVYRNIGIQGL